MPLEIREAGATTDPVECPFCGAVVLPVEDPDVIEPWNPSPACAHVWGLWHDFGIAYLSTAARAQLAASGILVVDDLTLGMSLEVPGDPDSEDEHDHLDLLIETIHGSGAVVLAVYTGPPTFEGSYAGVAEWVG